MWARVNGKRLVVNDMNNKKYTPGPWITEDGGFIYHLNDNGHNSFDVSVNPGCCCSDCRRLPKVDIKAITNLIVVSTELLEALEPFANFACDEWETHGCHNCVAKRVIAKALGEIK